MNLFKQVSALLIVLLLLAGPLELRAAETVSTPQISQDIEQLLAVLHRLRDHGNTIVVIEHNLDVIKTADWVIDLGPEGGDRGGEIIAIGTPEQLARLTNSHTGHFLAKLFDRYESIHKKSA